MAVTMKLIYPAATNAFINGFLLILNLTYIPARKFLAWTSQTCPELRRDLHHFQMMRKRETTVKRPPARRAASDRENGRSEVSITGVIAIKIIAKGIAHEVNLSHELNIFFGTNARIMAIGKKYRTKKYNG